MFIAIDGKPFTIPFPCGLKQYAQELIKHLAYLDKKNIYIIFSPKKIDIPIQKNFFQVNPGNNLPWQLAFPILFNRYRHKIDVLHILQQHGPLFIKHPKMIVTVHDFILRYAYPNFFENINYTFLKYYTNFTRGIICNRSNAIIAVSKFTRSEIIKYIKNKKVYVIYEGVDLDVYKYKRGIPNFGPTFFLTMTDFSPRKNIIRALKAFSLLPKNIRNIIQFKVVVSIDFPIQKINYISKKLKIQNHVQILKNIKNDELITLYNQAVCFIYPSLYEGFGLPILEAMACGCPVITSVGTATEEIAGEAAVLVDPYSVNDISDKMKILFTKPELRKELIRKGLERVKHFSWKKTAEKTLKIYEEVYAENRYST